MISSALSETSARSSDDMHHQSTGNCSSAGGRHLPSSVHIEDDSSTMLLRFGKSPKRKPTAVTPTSPASILKRTFSPRRRRSEDKVLGIGKSPFIPLEDEGKEEKDTGSVAPSAASSVDCSPHRLGIRRPSYKSTNSASSATPVVSPESNKDVPASEESSDMSSSDDTNVERRTDHQKSLLDPPQQREDENHSQSETISTTEQIPTPVDPVFVFDENSGISNPSSTERRSQEPGQCSSSKDQSHPAADSDVLRYPIERGRKAATTDMKRKYKESLKKIRVKDSKILWTKAGSRRSEAKLKDSKFKVFLLLLQPRTKIFELIQLVYPPETTTIGDLLAMIPKNATEPALGTQRYVGVTRPTRKSAEYTDLELMASNCKLNANGFISCGEILVAIPYGYDTGLIVSLGKHILSNRRIQKLMERSDPFAPSRKKSRRSKKSPSIEEMESVKEESGSESASSSGPLRTGLKRAIEKAAAANAAVNEVSSMKKPGPMTRAERVARPGRPEWSEKAVWRDSIGSYSSNEEDCTLADRSFSSWSQSFDSSLVISRSPVCSFTQSSSSDPMECRLRLLEQRAKYVSNFKLWVTIVGAAMVVRYLADPDGHVSIEQLQSEALGALGSLQFVTCFYFIVKIQRHVEMNTSAAALAS